MGIARNRSRRASLRSKLLLGVAIAAVAAGAAGATVAALNILRTPTPGVQAPPAAVAWPDYVRSGPPLVQESYQFALAHPEVLKYMPCSCGCVGSGHKSNLDCFIQRRDPAGAVVFEPHAAG